MFNPSKQQKAVAEWAKKAVGHLNLIARAGCGKTTTLLWLVPQLVGGIVFLAFNKSIKSEVSAKLQKKGIDWKTCEANTFHAMGLRAWKKVAEKNLLIEPKKVQNIIDVEYKAAYNARNDLKGDILSTCGQFLCQLISLAKQHAFGHLTNIDDSLAWQKLIDHHELEYQCADATDDELIKYAKQIYRISLDQCKHIVDFDDMILAPLVYNSRVWQYGWVMIDEAQDTNPARRAFAMKLLKKNGRLIAVGDPKQAIYGFTGADANSMQIIADQLGSTELPLNITYRCPKAVVKHANSIVPDIVADETAPEGSVTSINMRPMNEEDTTSFESIMPTLGPKDAVLCRNTRPLISLAYELLSKGIGCIVEGRDIGNGLINLAKRWKRIKTVQALVNKLEQYRDKEMSKAMSKGMEAKAESIDDKVSALLTICEHVGMDKKVTDIEREINKMFGDTKGTTPKVVTLSTVHKSKGREWKNVYLLGRNLYMPSPYARQDWQQEQEANLIYVAITRAQENFVEVIVDINEK